MKIGSPKEQFDGENRVAMTPASAKDLQKIGYDCVIESGAGAAAGFSDSREKVTVSLTASAGTDDEFCAGGWGIMIDIGGAMSIFIDDCVGIMLFS